MTEIELRRKVTTLAEQYANAGNIYEWTPELDELIRIYNEHKPLARNYKYKKEGGWCMLFPSVLYIQTGLDSLIKTEVGPWEAMQADKAAGRFREPLKYVPKPADLIYYYYETKDSKGKVIDAWYHVGIVTNADENVIYTTEGNVQDRVMMLAHSPADRTIVGFCAPDFASLADKDDPEIMIPPMPDAEGIYSLTAIVSGGRKDISWQRR